MIWGWLQSYEVIENNYYRSANMFKIANLNTENYLDQLVYSSCFDVWFNMLKKQKQHTTGSCLFSVHFAN